MSTLAEIEAAAGPAGVAAVPHHAIAGRGRGLATAALKSSSVISP